MLYKFITNKGGGGGGGDWEGDVRSKVKGMSIAIDLLLLTSSRGDAIHPSTRRGRRGERKEWGQDRKKGKEEAPFVSSFGVVTKSEKKGSI